MAESSGALHAPSRIERFLLVALALALLGSLAAAGLRSRTLATRGDLLAAASRGYQNLWLEVDAEAARAARAFAGFDLEAGDELGLFERAAAAISPDDPRGWSLFLLGPLGSMRAWSGAGLLHALDEDTLPQAGRAFRSSVTATSLLSILEIGGSSPWRVVVGISLPTEEL
ncbi:MAG: hypothetical protein O7A04_02330, partial [Acidobacteria bacterium]|nr:hypothetical protein [Acidobacteriota bacterium]